MLISSHRLSRVSFLVSIAGIALGITGCRLTQQQRIDAMNDQADRAEARADRLLDKRLKLCRGDPACEQAASDERATAIILLQAILDARFSGELQQAQAAENAWDEWLRSLPEEVRKSWEQLSSLLEKMKRLSLKSEGILSTSGLVMLSAQSQGGSADANSVNALDHQSAVSHAGSIIGEPGEWEEAFRLSISGSVSLEIAEDGNNTNTTAQFSLRGIYDGTIDPGDSIGLTSGSVNLFGGEMNVRLSSVVGASNLRIFSNGNGFLRIAGFAEHADERNDTDSGDHVILEIPVQLVGQNLLISSNDEFMPGNLFLGRPLDLIADYNSDSLVNFLDLTDFLTDYNSDNDYADVNADGLVDQDDYDLFISEYQDVSAWKVFRTEWSTGQ